MQQLRLKAVSMLLLRSCSNLLGLDENNSFVRLVCLAEKKKGFCALLDELIFDERTAPQDYHLLLQLLEEEKEQLSPTPKDAVAKMLREITLELIEKDIKNISDTEAVHEVTLDSVRKALCRR